VTGPRIDEKKWIWVAAGAVVLAGLVLRFLTCRESIFGDEMSTLWIVDGRSAGQVIDLVKSDAEISPPLFFLMAWLAEKIWHAPEAIRLPSMLAGAGLLPMIWLLARELFDRRTAAIATVLASLAPILVYLSANGRGYAVMLFFLATSTWAMLRAARSGRTGWWVLYAVSAAAAMYSHYTGAFYLLGQFIWLLFAYPGRRRAAVIASLGSAVLYLPWLGGFRADSDSPTTQLLEALQGHGFEAKRIAVEQLLFWQIRNDAWTLDGRVDAWLILAGAIVCASGVFLAIRRHRFSLRPGSPVALVLVLIFAVPIGSLVAGLVSTETFGGRNLAACWIGLVLLGGIGVVRAGRSLGLVALILILAGFTIGSVRLADPGRTELKYADAAAFIETNSGPDDAIVDNSHITPVPLTPLDAYLDSGHGREYRINLQTGDPPFLPGGHRPDPQTQIRQAFAGDGKVFVVTLVNQDQLLDGRLDLGEGYVEIPRGWRAVEQKVFDGLYPVAVTVFEREPGKGSDNDE
jgi:hypothetical protein